VFCLGHVILRERKKTAGGKTVLTLAHWQLEPGVTIGLDHMAVLYNEERARQGLPPIEFRQMPIPETGYSQWVTTQLMGGTAPDLLEIGQMPWETLIRYRAYYMVPITAELFKPNPYNRDNEMRDEPWKNTFKDGLGEGVRALQEYYEVGFSAFSMRLYFNRALLKQVTAELARQGKLPAALDTPPTDLRKFFELCDLIGTTTDERGRPYYPIAGGKYQFSIMNWSIIEPLTASLMDIIDESHDCSANNDETFFALCEGRLKFTDPRLQKIMQLSRELARRFPPGWNGLTRDDAVMQFVQWRSVFIATGSWDGLTLKEQARMGVRPFEVGISQFPKASPDDPQWGDIAWGRYYERSETEFAFALTKACKHPDIALDFLRFVTSRKGNEELNRKIMWIPVIKGADMAEDLRAFEPLYDGVSRGWNPEMGGKSQIVIGQTTPLLQLGEDAAGRPFGIKDWTERMLTEWLPAAVLDFEQRDDTLRDNLRAKETVSALLRAKMLSAPSEQWFSYYKQRYTASVRELVSAPREIAHCQHRLREAREKGLLP
jgi:raffinose/stachyose/melibiose transport system substrate-binding protein